MPRRQSKRDDNDNITDVEHEIAQEECVEVKLESREEEILRRLGIIHLENKVTRPRYSNDETDAMILKQAGVKLYNVDDCEASGKDQRDEDEVSEEKWSKPLSVKEAEILRSAGVTLLENTPIRYDEDSFCHKLDCATIATAAITIGESTVNSTYAEKELLRRLKKGWSTTGEKCLDCGLPIICKSKGNKLLECVICGVVGGEDNFNPDMEATSLDVDDPTIGTVEEMEIPGILHVGTFVSTIGHDYESHYSEQPLVGTISTEKETNEMDSMYTEELGRRLFDGWVISTSKCTQCNKRLVSEFDGAPCICLICG